MPLCAIAVLLLGAAGMRACVAARRPIRRGRCHRCGVAVWRARRVCAVSAAAVPLERVVAADMCVRVRAVCGPAIDARRV